MRLDHFSTSGKVEASPKLGLILSTDESSTWKLLYSQGYRAPAAGEIDGTGAFLGNEDLTGETLSTIEAIYEKRVQDFQLTTTLFASKWENAITNMPTQSAIEQGFSGEYVNSGENSAH